MEIFESNPHVRCDPIVLDVSTAVSGMPQPLLMAKVGRLLSSETPIYRPPLIIYGLVQIGHMSQSDSPSLKPEIGTTKDGGC